MNKKILIPVIAVVILIGYCFWKKKDKGVVKRGLGELDTYYLYKSFKKEKKR
jgi:hypothetical protein